MQAQIIDTVEIENQHFVASKSGAILTAFEVSLADLESEELTAIENALSETLKSLSPTIRMRSWLSSKALFETDEKDGEPVHSRSVAIGELGSIENHAYLIFEMDSGNIRDLLQILKTKAVSAEPLEIKALELKSGFDLGHLKSVGFKVRPLTLNEISSLSANCVSTHLQKLPFGIDLGDKITGYVRLSALGVSAVSIETLGKLKDRLPLPYKIKTTVQRIPQAQAEALLRRKSAKSKTGSDDIAAHKFSEAQNQLTDLSLMGGTLFHFEMVIELERQDEKTLRQDLNEVAQILKPLSDFAVETVGAYPTFMAQQLGNKMHVPLLETEKVLPSFLPIFTTGESPSFNGQVQKRNCALLRSDESVYYFDPFNPAYDNYSVCIFGKSGKGKSVLTNLLTRSLHFDEKVKIIKVDVGGSHSKETELLGGEEFKLSLSKPSGINPFAILKQSDHSDDVCSIISSFLNVLLLEEGETFLSKTMRGAIEQAVTHYSSTRPLSPSVDDFYAKATTLPRRELLKRWTTQGIFGKAFSVSDSSSTFSSSPSGHTESQEKGGMSSAARLRYYNFSEIAQASDPDFGQGGLAAVMLMFNLELMRDRESKHVFIADETPFFIERCFSFFKFSTANVRKFGGSFITIAQTSSNVVVKGDTGILDNSNSKFLFSTDGADAEAFRARLKFNPRDYAKLESLHGIKGEYSEVLLHDNQGGSKTLRIRLTPQEYWAATSSHDDNRILMALRQSVEGLTLQQAIAVLSL